MKKLFNAVRNNDFRLVRKLIDNGVDVNARNIYGSTPLHHAKYVKMAQLLLDNGADVRAKDAYGYTPLQLASKPEVNVVMRLHIESEMW